MGEEYEVFIESSVRGYHAYFVDASVAIGEVLTCEREIDNVHDKYAIAVKNEDQALVGHVPIELSKIFSRFLRDYGEIEAECIGARCQVDATHGHSFRTKLFNQTSPKCTSSKEAIPLHEVRETPIAHAQ